MRTASSLLWHKGMVGEAKQGETNERQEGELVAWERETGLSLFQWSLRLSKREIKKQNNVCILLPWPLSFCLSSLYIFVINFSISFPLPFSFLISSFSSICLALLILPSSYPQLSSSPPPPHTLTGESSTTSSSSSSSSPSSSPSSSNSSSPTTLVSVWCVPLRCTGPEPFVRWKVAAWSSTNTWGGGGGGGEWGSRDQQGEGGI